MHTEWIGGEAVVLDRSSGELHYLNGSAALVVALIEELGYERGIAEVASRFDLDPGRGELYTLLRELEETGILTGGTRGRAEAVGPTAQGEPRAEPG